MPCEFYQIRGVRAWRCSCPALVQRGSRSGAGEQRASDPIVAADPCATLLPSRPLVGRRTRAVGQLAVVCCATVPAVPGVVQWETKRLTLVPGRGALLRCARVSRNAQVQGMNSHLAVAGMGQTPTANGTRRRTCSALRDGNRRRSLMGVGRRVDVLFRGVCKEVVVMVVVGLAGTGFSAGGPG